MASVQQWLRISCHKMGWPFAIFACFLLSSLVSLAYAASELDRAKHIQDDALKACVLAQLPENGKPLSRLKCHSKGIASLNGLENFHKLKELSLFNNAITGISIDSWPALEMLNIAKNPISSLIIEHSELTKLYAFSTMLTELSLNAPKLELLKANNSQLVTIQLLAVPKLSKCDIYNNQLKTMAIAPLTACKHLDVRNNPMPDDLYDRMDNMPCLVLHDGNAEDWQ